MKTSSDTADIRRSAHQDAAAFRLPEGWCSGREILSGITIDAEHTRDRDDAIWLLPHEEGVVVHVAISDVGAFLDASSAMAAYAEQMGETRYLRTNNIPMLPPAVSEGVLSLLETQDTPVVCLAVTLNQSRDVTAVEFTLGRIRPQRMTYQRLRRPSGTEGEPDLADGFGVYGQFAVDLLRHRRDRGAFAFYDPITGRTANEDGAIVELRHPGELIVQEFMILANTAVAEYMWRHDIPGLFRNHSMAIEIPMDQAIDMAVSGSPQQLAALRQGFGRACYDVVIKGHAGLNLEAYTHWTSPLRRFADFANHLNLTAHLHGQRPPYPRERLEEIAQHLNSVQDEIRDGRARHFKTIRLAANVRQLGKSSEELLALSADDFYAVVKMAAKTGIAPEELASAVARRAEDGALGPRELTHLVFASPAEGEGWREIDRAVLAHLRLNPSDAVSVLSYANQSGLIDSLSYEFPADESGLGFRCEAALSMCDGTAMTAGAARSSKRTAQQEAAVALVFRLKGEEQPPQSPAVERAGHDNEGFGAANPKGFLQEQMQKHGQPLPAYKTRERGASGPGHAFETTVTLQLDGKTLTFTGEGGTKKTSEVSAADHAIDALDTAWEVGQRCAGQIRKAPLKLSNSPISALQEWCQTRGMELPEYRVEQNDLDGHSHFGCTVAFRDEDGTLLECSAVGGSKQRAKRLAALAALQLVGIR